MISITSKPIDATTVINSVANSNAGATLLFLGTTREFTGDKQTTSLEYECYEEMALAKLNELRDTAMKQWPLTGCTIVHRIGNVDIGETSVAIAVSSPHRIDGFTAGKWLIDTLKEVVPIWKKELWSDGTSEWVHPDTSSDQAAGN